MRSAVRADLLEHYGVDLAVEASRLNGRKIVELLEQLPQHSRWQDFVANDEGMVEQLKQLDPRAFDNVGRSYIGFTPEVAASYMIRDGINDLIMVVSALGGSKVDIPQVERPTSARDVVVRQKVVELAKIKKFEREQDIMTNMPWRGHKEKNG